MKVTSRRGIEPSRAWRLRPWPSDPAIAHLIFVDHTQVPEPDEIDDALATAFAHGARSVRTSAMFPRAAEAAAEAGFEPLQTLALLRLDLTATQPQPRTSSDRLTDPLWRYQLGRAAAIDRAAFGDEWGLDVASLREIRVATAAYRARAIRTGRRLSGYAVTGAAGPNGYLQRLAVHPDHQRRGHAAALVTDSLAWMRRTGRHAALVNTGTDNAAALALYRGFGFDRLSEQLVIAHYTRPR